VSLGPAPPPLPARDPISIPIIPLLAPLALSLVMALVLHSALALMMGFMGPLMVLGGWWHHKKIAAKDARSAKAEHDAATEAYAAALQTARSRERGHASRIAPSVLEWSHDPMWREPATAPEVVRIGQGWWTPPMGHALSGTEALGAMPAAVDVLRGIALIGGPEAEDVWRNIVLQWWMGSGVEGLEPALRGSGEPFPTDIKGASRAVWVRSLADVPGECQTLLILSGGPLGTVHVSGEMPRQIKCDRITLVEALRALRKRTITTVEPGSSVVEGPNRSTLWARLSPEAAGIDLVREGPHAVVWGATGSGKSQSVCSLVLSLAASYEPHDLVVVVIDFKGGAGLRPLSTLPHTIGMVTDLDPLRSSRARAGLESEMVKRERILSAHGVPDVADLPDSTWCPRLLVVVDEVAWLLTTAPEWADTLSDLTQRGRSLGIHVILSTQRVSGVLPRALMANVSLRICGRVTDDQEVAEWMPELSASQKNTLRHVAPGRALVAGATRAPAWHDVALASNENSSRESEKSHWRVWSEELPHTIAYERGVWGWGDYPELQTKEKLTSDPLSAGSIVIVGDSGSGRTTAAHAVSALSHVSVVAPRDPAGAWACVQEHQGTGATIVIDDADHLLHQAGSEGEVFLMDALEGYDGKLVLTLGPRHRLCRGLARLTPQRLVLSLADKDDQVQWGGPGLTVPGRGRFAGVEIQISASQPILPWAPPQLSEAVTPPIVLSETPEVWEGVPTSFLGTPDQAMAGWHTLGPLTSRADVLVQGVSHRDIRVASSGRITLPPLVPQVGWVWVWRAGRALIAKPVAPERSPQ